jgi:hypothetical protein
VPRPPPPPPATACPSNGEDLLLPGAGFCRFDVEINAIENNEFATTTTPADGTTFTHVT